MQPPSKSSILVLGLAIFAMFFGAGNIIFPLYVGQLAGENYFWGLAGFCLTGVLLPFLGVLTMVIYDGDYTRFFGTLGKNIGFLFTLALLSVWIPLGCAPRCVTLSFVNVKSVLGDFPIWIFSLAYCILVYVIASKKSRALDIIGYVLTPLLLLSLGFVVFEGLRYSPGTGPSQMTEGSLMLTGLYEGYYTMDLIASFFFTSTVIVTLREIAKTESDSKHVIGVAMKSCAIGMAVLSVVYMGLVGVAAANAHILVGVPKDELLVKLVTELLGPQMRIVSTIAVVLACFTTSIALQIVYSDFLTNNVLKGKISKKTGSLLTLATTFGMSILGFKGISNITGPILDIFYPLLLVLIVWNIAIKPLLTRYTGAYQDIQIKEV